MQTKSRMRFHWLEKLAFKALFRVYWYLVNDLTNFDPSIKERNSKTTLCRWWWCYFFSYSSLHTKEPTFKQWKDNISGISVAVVPQPSLVWTMPMIWLNWNTLKLGAVAHLYFINKKTPSKDFTPLLNKVCKNRESHGKLK